MWMQLHSAVWIEQMCPPPHSRLSVMLAECVPLCHTVECHSKHVSSGHVWVYLISLLTNCTQSAARKLPPSAFILRVALPQTLLPQAADIFCRSYPQWELFVYFSSSQLTGVTGFENIWTLCPYLDKKRWTYIVSVLLKPPIFSDFLCLVSFFPSSPPLRSSFIPLLPSFSLPVGIVSLTELARSRSPRQPGQKLTLATTHNQRRPRSAEGAWTTQTRLPMART